jgi:hypothetical protein
MHVVLPPQPGADDGTQHDCSPGQLAPQLGEPFG